MASMTYFDSDMSNSTKTIVRFDGKFIYIISIIIRQKEYLHSI